MVWLCNDKTPKIETTDRSLLCLFGSLFPYLLEEVEGADSHPYYYASLGALSPKLKVDAEQHIQSYDGEDHDYVSEKVLGLQQVGLLFVLSVVFGQAREMY